MAPTWFSGVIVTIAILEGTYGADSVTQTDGSVFFSQGDPVLLNCTYQVSGFPYPVWYVQYPNQALRLFLRDLGREDSDEGITKGFNASHDKKHKSFHLWKPSSELSDSATYYCAASNTLTLSSRGAAQKPGRVCAEQQGYGHPGLGATQGRGSLQILNLEQKSFSLSFP
ncbi:unnamed protein product [Eretmochelys imbricata]